MHLCDTSRLQIACSSTRVINISVNCLSDFRNEGNVYFKRKRDVKALVAYNSSVASAPVNSGNQWALR